MRGVKYLGTKRLWEMPKKFNGASKRGIWRINV